MIEYSPREPKAAPVLPLGIAADVRNGKGKSNRRSLLRPLSAHFCFSRSNCCSENRFCRSSAVHQRLDDLPSCLPIVASRRIWLLPCHGHVGFASRQFVIHGVALGLSAVMLIILGHFWSTPISPGVSWRPPPSADPTWIIARFLLLAIGLPFFLLSTTSPLIQRWFAKASPQVAVSALRALECRIIAGLLSYPFWWNHFCG